jgi:hypothetical protein
MDMRFGLWNVRSLYREGSLMTVSRELARYKLDLVGVQEVRWEGFDNERFNLKKLKDVEGKEQFRIEVSNMFAALEDLDTEVEINSAWETITVFAGSK